MSLTVPPCLAALGFSDTHDLDERTIRRAYARQLKQIDVEAEPQRFQALRETLDQSLRWLSMRDRAAAAESPPPTRELDADAAPSAAAAPCRPTSASPTAPASAEAIGQAVYARFHARVTAVFRHAVGAREALDEALSDDRLINIDARNVFESNVARLLANGWHPGHDHLFDPAVEAFGWEGDHARLANFGQVGALLSAAIRDRVVFHDLTPEQKVVLNRLLVRVRDATAPDPARLREEVPQLQYLVNRVPNWLRVVAPVDPVNARFEMWRNSPASMMPAPPATRRKASASGKEVLVVVGVIMAIVLAGYVNRASRSENAVWSPPQAVPPPTIADVDLQNRQKRAEALLSGILAARAAAPSRRDIP